MSFKNEPIPNPPPLPIASPLKILEKTIAYLEGCSWASDFPDLRSACIRNNIFNHRKPTKFHYRCLPSILQEGPTCGLIALSILLNARISPERLLALAKENGFSNNGEMFSAKNMNLLLNTALGELGENKIESALKKGCLTDGEVVDFLLNGGAALVPYDSDANHSPCLKKGHKAHWAIVLGILFDDEINVLAKHGKSRHLAVWSLRNLSQSNSNLVEFSTERSTDGLTYIIPEDGVGGNDGLRNQFILIKFSK